MRVDPNGGRSWPPLGDGRCWGVYVHVPWCRVRCPYCAFYVVPDRGAPEWRPFVDRILGERDLRAFPGRPSTLSFGGGTPSRLPPDALAVLVAGLAPTGEVSSEANPEDVTPEWLTGALAAGIDRLSLGVQSFDPAVAGRLGRLHTAREADEVCRRVAASGVRSWSVDLIFAVPGQTLADLDADLDRVLDLGAPHVSVYGLTVEDGTPFAKIGLRPADDDQWRAMYDRIVARLSAAGIERYEVSNFAREGHRSAHNRLYWSDAPYLGLGPSAHGYAPDGERWVNVPDLGRYLREADPTAHRERPEREQAAADYVVGALRAVEGLDLGRMRARWGLEPDPEVVARLERGGLVRAHRDRVALTDQGFPVCDAVQAALTGSWVDGERLS